MHYKLVLLFDFFYIYYYNQKHEKIYVHGNSNQKNN
jgi:hypothetical protein